MLCLQSSTIHVSNIASLFSLLYNTSDNDNEVPICVLVGLFYIGMKKHVTWKNLLFPTFIHSFFLFSQLNSFDNICHSFIFSSLYRFIRTCDVMSVTVNIYIMFYIYITEMFIFYILYEFREPISHIPFIMCVKISMLIENLLLIRYIISDT